MTAIYASPLRWIKLAEYCRLRGQPAAEVLRDFMRAYVARERGGQASLFAKTDLAMPREKTR